MLPQATRIDTGQTGYAVMPYSEVMMHLGIAGQRWYFRRVGSMAQIIRADGTDYSFPVTGGEAGIHFDRGGAYYYAA